MSHSNGRRYTSLGEAQAKLRISEAKLWRIRLGPDRDPSFPTAIKIGRRVLLAEDELDIWTERKREAAP